MRRHLIAVVVGAGLASCGKPRDEPAAGGAGSMIAREDASAATAPAITPAQFLAEPTAFTIEAIERGLWISDGGGAFVQACRVELGMAMGRFGKLRGAAMTAPERVTCASEGSHAVCSFALPDGTAAPDTRASWIFATDDDSDATVLIAVLFGAHDVAERVRALPPKRACPRPSADPP